MNILDQIGQNEINKVLANRDIPDFGAGDTLRVDVKVVEGTRVNVFRRLKAFALPVKSDGVNSSFTVRKISYGEGVERIFPYIHRVIRHYGYSSR